MLQQVRNAETFTVVQPSLPAGSAGAKATTQADKQNYFLKQVSLSKGNHAGRQANLFCKAGL